MSTKEGISKVFASKIFHTVRKFHNFSITEILREINFEDSKSAKIHKNQNSEPFEYVEKADFALLKFLKLISRKI